MAIQCKSSRLKRRSGAIPWDAPGKLDVDTMEVVASPEEFRLESGEMFGPITVAYETYGHLNESRDNVVLIAHALTGDSHVTQRFPSDRIGWLNDLVGPGRAIDTSRFFVICPNVLGGCSGTTGPSSINPGTGKPYAMEFPVITVRDMVRVQKTLLERLGIKRLCATIGGSMGGMQVLEWATTYPDCVDKAIVIASPGRSHAQSIAYNEVMRRAIMLDPNWNEGNYYGGEPPSAGLSIARMLGMITYQSNDSMDRKFSRMLCAESQIYEPHSKFEVQNYLEYQGQKLVRRFDANTYLCFLKAMDLHDLGRGRTSYKEALALITAKVLVIGISSDILYPTYQEKLLVHELRKANVNATYVQIDSPHGHDAFLIDFDQFGPVINGFIQS